MRQCAKKRGVSIELLLLAEETPYSRPWLLSSLAQIFKRDVRIYDAYKVMHKSDQTNHQDKSFKIDDHFLSTENGKWSIIPCFRYGQGFGLFPKDSIFNIPNTLYGLGFYGLAAVLGMCSCIWIISARANAYVNNKVLLFQVWSTIMLAPASWVFSHCFPIFVPYTWLSYYICTVSFALSA